MQTVETIMKSWRDGCLADHEAILQIIAQPRHSATYMIEQITMIAEIAQAQEKIMRERERAQFLTFIEESVCVEAIGASLSAQIIKCLMDAWDRDEIIWQPGQLDFTYQRKG